MTGDPLAAKARRRCLFEVDRHKTPTGQAPPTRLSHGVGRVHQKSEKLPQSMNKGENVMIHRIALGAVLAITMAAAPALAADPFSEADLGRILQPIDHACLEGTSVSPEEKVVKCTAALADLTVLHSKAQTATEAAGISFLSGLFAMNEATAYVEIDKALSVRACGTVEGAYALVSPIDPQLLNEKLRLSLLNLRQGLSKSADRCGQDFGAFPGGSTTFATHKFSDVDFFRITTMADQGCTIAASSATLDQTTTQCTLAIATIAALQAKPQSAAERAGLGLLNLIYLTHRGNAYSKIDHTRSPRTCQDMQQAYVQIGTIDAAQFDDSVLSAYQSTRDTLREAAESCAKN